MKTSPAAFVRQVKQEVSKITWPTRQEAWRMTLVVVVLCALLALFFLLVDEVSIAVVRMILGIGA